MREAITLIYKKGIKGRRDRFIHIKLDNLNHKHQVINAKSNKDISHKFELYEPYMADYEK